MKYQTAWEQNKQQVVADYLQAIGGDCEIRRAVLGEQLKNIANIEIKNGIEKAKGEAGRPKNG